VRYPVAVRCSDTPGFGAEAVARTDDGMARLLILLAVLALGGCSNLSYYVQSVRGQLGLVGASRPLEAVLADTDTAESVRRHLQQLPALRQFAFGELALPETDSYSLYADVRREALVWNVVAAPVDSLRPREWCYPVVGCAAYRGYFSRQDAVAYAAELTDGGWDSAVEPVPAYSTLGWFSDPLPSTVIEWPLTDIAGLLFHELAHEALYLPGDSSFNEAYATVVEDEGIRRWLQRHGSDEERRTHALGQQRREAFLRLVGLIREQLAELYAADVEHDLLLERKLAIFHELRDGYALLKDSWGGYSGYDRWFARPLNNAHFASINTYHALEPAFWGILLRANGDMAAFHARCREIAAMPTEGREAVLKELLDEAADG